MDAYRLTPPSTEVRAIAAYLDEEEGRQQLGRSRAQPDDIALGKLAFVIGQELLTPLVVDKRTIVKLCYVRAICLLNPFIAPSARISAHGRKLRSTRSPGAEKRSRARSMNFSRTIGLKNSIQRYFAKHRRRFIVNAVLTVVGVGSPIALHEPHAAGLLGLMPGGFEVVKFGAGEFIGALEQPKSEAAAMFVTAKQALR